MISTIFLIFAFVLFVLAGINLASARVNLIGLGLACWVLSILLQGVKI